VIKSAEMVVASVAMHCFKGGVHPRCVAFSWPVPRISHSDVMAGFSGRDCCLA
jgi:hypothetical protein